MLKKKSKKSSPKKKKTVKKTATKKKAAKKITKKNLTVKKAAASSTPAPGRTAPAFSMKTDNAGTVKLSNFKGKSPVVLYFYPKDDTPGCTVEACAFQKSLSAYKKSKAVIIGVSPDTIESHTKFRKKYGLDFILASDPDHSVAEKYGLWVLKNNYGKKYMGVQRGTFLIGKDGKIAAAWPKVKVVGHDDEVRAAIAALK